MAKLQNALIKFIEKNIWDTKVNVDEARVLDVIVDPWTQQYGIDKPIEMEEYGKVYQVNENVYSCVKVIAEASNDIPLKVFEYKNIKGEAKYVEVTNPTNPINQLFSKVNDHTTENEFKEQSLSSLELQGNSYWWIVRNGLNIPIQLHFMRPDFVTIVPDPNVPGGVKSYVFESDGRKDIFDASEILHFKYFNPRSQFYGQSPLTAARVTIEADIYAKVYNKQFFRNSARPYGVLKSKVNLDAKSRKRLKKMWNAAHQGSDKAYRTALLEGDLDYKQLGLSQRDSDFIDQLKMYREVILAIFKVPPAMMNVYEYANYSNVKEQRKIFWTDVMTKKLNKISSYINEFLLAPVWGIQYKVAYDYSDIEVLRENENEKIERVVSQITNGLMTLEQGREVLGNDSDGVFYLPFNMAPIGAASSVKSLELKKKSIDIAKNLNETREKGISRIRSRYNSALGDMFKEQGSKLVKIIIDDIERQKFKAVEEPPIIDVDKLWEDNELGIMIVAVSALFISQFMEQGIATARTLSNIDIAFGIDHPVLAGSTDSLLSELSAQTSLASKTELKRIITAGIENNVTVDGMTGQIKDMMEKKWEVEYPKYRAERIARTEASRAYGKACHEYYKEAGVPKHEWLTVGSEQSQRDICGINEAEGPIPINQAFKSGDEHEPAHVNCKCNVSPVSE